MMRQAIGAVVAAGMLAVSAQARDDSGHETAAPPQAVSIGFSAVSPERLDIVAGDTVRWTNDSVRVHTVTADDGSFDSGRIGAAQTFSRRFAVAGLMPYHCTLHPFIKGVAAVNDLLLDAPAAAAAPKRAFPLSGRASAALPAGAVVSIERDAGAGFGAVTATALSADGTFSARLDAPVSGSYRAVAGAVTSPPVELVVLDRRVSLGVKRARGRVVLRARVAPAAPGGRVVLQLLLPERFGWWPVERAHLDATSAARFELRPRRRLRARVRLTLPDGATALATSRSVWIGPAR